MGRPRWWPGPLVAIASLALCLLALEGLARVYVGRLTPTRLRDGVYLNRLPLITGVTPAAFQGALYPGDRLSEAKVPGELRVAVVGESSVEGSPFSPHASAPTMLHDRLREVFPDRSVTVMNLGRVGSIAANAWYTLVWLRRFAPDVVVLYMGYNDAPELGGEQCWAAEHPDAHAAWRWLVQRSWLLWTVRAIGPAQVAKLTGAADAYRPQYRPTPCPALAFPVWARWVVQAAAATGARVVVTVPVRNPLAHLEPGLTPDPGGRSSLSTLDPKYADLLRCRLTPGCDLAPLLDAALEAPIRQGQATFPLSDAPGPPRTASTPLESWTAERRLVSSAWNRAADLFHAAVLDFAAVVARVGGHGPYGLDLFVDEIHLSLEGYQLLAWQWAEAIRTEVARPRSPARLLPDPADLERYRADCRYVSTGVALNFFLRGWYLSALPLMQLAASWCPQGRCDPAAPVAVAWLKKGLGMDPGVPAEQLPAVEAFTPLEWLD